MGTSNAKSQIRRLAMQLVTLSFTLLHLHAASLVTYAQGPTWTSIFPAGGQRGTQIEVTCNGTFPKWPVKIWCNQSDCVCTPTETSGKIKIAIAPEATLGVRWLRVYDEKGASSLRPFVIGAIAEIQESKDNGKTIQSENVATLPVTINGVLEKSSNIDSYSVTLKKGETLVASLDANRGPKSPVDATLQVLNANGIVLEQNLDSHGLDPQIAFVAPYDGSFQVRVFGFPEAPDSTIAFASGPTLVYRLTLTTGPYLEAAMPMAVSSKDPTELRPIGFNVGGLEKLTIAADPNSAANNLTNKSIVFASTVGSLALPVKSCPVLVEQDSADGTSTKQTVSIPSCITGRIQSVKEKDNFVFSAKAGTRWKIRLESRTLGYPMDGVLTLNDSQGKQLVRQDDSESMPDPTISWQCPADGEYSLVVSDLYDQSSDFHIYRLTIEEDMARAQLTVPNDLLKGNVGKPLEIEVKIQRLLDYAEELAISIEDAPTTITVTPVPSTTGNDSAKSVKLSIQSAEPYQGPIRIIALPKSNIENKIVATAVDSVQSLLWLSITEM